MSVVTDFKQYIRDSGFLELMESHGFSLAKEKLWFYRLRGEFIDCLTLQTIAAGKGVRFHVSTYVFDMFPEYDESQFPKGFIYVKSNIANKFLNESGVGFSSGNWDTSGKGRALKTLKEASDLVESDLLPWFEHIDSRKKLYESIFEPEDSGFDYLLN